MQKAFESLCKMEETDAILKMLRGSRLFIHWDLLTTLINHSNTDSLLLLLMHASAFYIKGENLDPDGICGTILK